MGLPDAEVADQNAQHFVKFLAYESACDKFDIGNVAIYLLPNVHIQQARYGHACKSGREAHPIRRTVWPQNSDAGQPARRLNLPL